MGTQYMNTFDVEEFKLFRKFNNATERTARHIDVYHVEDVNDVVKIEYNKEQAGKDLREQLQKLQFVE
jgi:hypothetical protein